jgi:hypothetical protein
MAVTKGKAGAARKPSGNCPMRRKGPAAGRKHLRHVKEWDTDDSPLEVAGNRSKPPPDRGIQGQGRRRQFTTGLAVWTEHEIPLLSSPLRSGSVARKTKKTLLETAPPEV